MVWDEGYMIGNGERVTDETSKPVYRNYAECGIIMDQAMFDQITEHFKVYYETEVLKNIVFTPRNVLKQTSSNYYFLHLDIKIPRNN